MKLYLTLLDVKGGSGASYTLNFSEIAEQIYTDSAYFSNRRVLSAGYDVNNIELPVLKPDTINNIVINLPVEFGYHLTRDTTKFFYNNSNTDFRSYFKGLYFSISPSANPLLVALSVGPPSSYGAYNNYFVLFMHDEALVQKQYFFILDAMNRNAAFNRFTHDFTTASPGKKIENINKPYRDTLSYLQYLNGVYTRIVFPGLESLKNDPSFKNIAVNKARLTIPVYYDGDLYRRSTVPSQLLLRYKTNSGAQYIVPDYGIDAEFFDGKIDTIADVYNFNIPAFVQGYLEDATNGFKPELDIFYQQVWQRMLY